MQVSDIRKLFVDELAAERFTEDRTGGKTIEVLGASFTADEPAIFGIPNQTYIEAELQWYLNGSTNINDIWKEKSPPQAWEIAANEHGEINSNYGHLIFDDKFYRQYDMVIAELIRNPDSRRASMIYTRPSIWIEYNENGKNDFICTNSVTYYMRDHKLHCVVQMRSNDVVFGYKNDYAWQKYVLDKLCEDLMLHGAYSDIESGNITWQVQNLHVYERHFRLVC
jgi:thymidylate synthase